MTARARRSGLLALLGLFALHPAAALAKRGIDRIDFKYSSNHHLEPVQRFVDLSAEPKTVEKVVAALLRGDGGLILQRTAGAGLVVSTNRDTAKCWAEAKRITAAEWSAYTLNDFGAYKRIDRSAACLEVQVTEATAEVDSWLVKAEFPAQAAEQIVLKPRLAGIGVDLSNVVFATTPEEALLGVLSGVHAEGTVVEQAVSTSFASRINFSIWRDGDRTRVYSWAVPTNSGVEAAPGNSIGLIWFDQVRGDREMRLVRTYLDALQTLADGGEL